MPAGAPLASAGSAADPDRWLARLERIYACCGDGILVVDANGIVVSANPAARALFGQARAYEGLPLAELLPPDRRAAHAAHFAQFRDGVDGARPMQQRNIVRGVHADGHELALEVTIARMAVGGRTELLATIRDASDRARLIEALRSAASTDALTGIANRRRIEQAIGAELARAARYRHTLALLMIDIDHFKRVNDRYGHAVGDAVLRGLAAEVQACLRGPDLVGRWGGEELLVLLPEADAAAATQCAERIRGRIGSWHCAGPAGERVAVTVSIGVATAATEAQDSVDALVARADAAMYAAKRAGRDCVRVRQPGDAD